jgi:hypothetical protein
MIRSVPQRHTLPIISGNEELWVLWLGIFGGIVTSAWCCDVWDGRTDWSVTWCVNWQVDRLYVMGLYCCWQAQTVSVDNKSNNGRCVPQTGHWATSVLLNTAFESNSMKLQDSSHMAVLCCRMNVKWCTDTKHSHILHIDPLKHSGNYMYFQFNIQQFYVLPTQCIYVFCVDLRTNSSYFPIQH